MANLSRMVWIDLEMTGLDPDTHVVLEIATIITDGELNTLAEGPVIAIARTSKELSRIDNWSFEHHTKSGLLQRVEDSNIGIEEAELITLEFVKEWVGVHESPLCGNSVHQDRLFLRKEMKKLESYLHYRIVDVSTIKGLAEKWYPDLEKFPKKGTHLALDDIYESIGELRYYRQNIFKIIV